MGERNIALVFPDRLQEAITESGKTVARVAKDTDIPYALISKYLRGVSLPSAPSVAKLADALRVTTDYLLGRMEKDDLPREELRHQIEALKREKGELMRDIGRYRKMLSALRNILDYM